MNQILTFLGCLLQRLFPDKASSLRSDIANWYRGAIERATLRKKETEDGQKKPD
jgi:hypothetical protein